METEDVYLRDQHLKISGDFSPTEIIIQPADSNEFASIQEEIDFYLSSGGEKRILVVALEIQKWNRDLTPWEASPVFGKEPFGCGAENTLNYILETLIPYLKNRFGTQNIYLCGYSLAGLFALWAAYQTDVFEGVAAVSPSVWYPNWIEYARNHRVKAKKVYLSLGDKESKTKNPIMATVMDGILEQSKILMNQQIECVLNWNPGNHFVDSDHRVAKGIRWLLDNNQQ
ncbi:MAG: hypothetical protein K5694_06220 [Bacilli bacterium]|nr:hypothetical protein [Bacilli bacterium]